jgi:HK97 gp10 family phage protein
MITAKFDGLKEIEKRLKELPEKIQGKVLRTATMAGGRLIAKEIKRRVPTATGNLKRSIRTVNLRNKGRKSRAEVAVGVQRIVKPRKSRKNPNRQQRYTDVFYWRFLEFGTKHIPAKSFIRSSFEDKKRDAVEEIRSRLKKRIAIEVKKLGGS